MSSPDAFMQEALKLAQEAEALGEVPVGAVVVKDGAIVGRGFNQPIHSKDPTAHAEIVALRDAAQQLNNYRLLDCDLYVTIEPCAMCAGAIVHSRINKVYFGAVEPKAGAVVSTQQFFDAPQINHRVAYQANVQAEPCANLIRLFFEKKRRK